MDPHLPMDEGNSWERESNASTTPEVGSVVSLEEDDAEDVADDNPSSEQVSTEGTEDGDSASSNTSQFGGRPQRQTSSTSDDL